MCGIAGFAGKFPPTLLDRMAELLAHRGPDDAGTLYLSEPDIGLAHRRLSIIDLSPAGHQPMWDATRTVAIVFNGEIYNYRELRAELVASGYAFHGASDTEVLLNLYLRDGDNMLARLNGIFAFAIWDRRDCSLFLARDGLGVKPLYYAEPSGGFLFASELKALLAEPSVPRDLDSMAVQAYLTYLWCPAPHTLLRAVKKLEPGYALRVQGGRIVRQWRYYDLPYAASIEPLSERDAVGAVRATLKTAVARQMVADVPVGAFLSGGLDSSAVAAMAREHTAGRLQCFTIGLQGAADGWEGMADDLPYAQRVAKHLGVDLHVVHVGPEMADRLSEMIYHLDEPQADPAPLNVLFISELARRMDIKVLLSGAGGDDLFTGYRRHYALSQERFLTWLPRLVRRGLSVVADALPPTFPLARRASRALRYLDLPPNERIASYFYWSTPQTVSALIGPALRESLAASSPAASLLASLANLPSSTPMLNRMLYLEAKHFLADHNLNYTDKMSMAAGVEVRVPLLDPDLVSLAARLPLTFKQRGRAGKWILKRAMEGVLPHDVIYRPKTGFGAPLRRWLRHELQPVVEETLSAASLTRRGLFEPAVVRSLVDADRAGRVDAAYTIFAMICIELWCRTFLDRDIARDGYRRSVVAH
ncbi:MAG TPA: asparagine synthase (glutamine-hydrolyzing) [Burkholderiales bacterium]|nr:asparagine synthase (glutamine-hydrolyzing) [Burkholderiales bacterium]